MSKRKNLAGITSLSLPVFAGDSSSSTGAGLSGLVYNSSGLVAEYRRQGASTWTAITLSAGTLGTWSSGGFVADGSLGGSYELGVPNAAVATGAQWVVIRLYGATNMLPVLSEIELDAVNYQDAIHFGLSALPAAVAGASGGLPLANSVGNVPADVQTIKTQAVTASAPVAVLASVGTAATSTAQTGDSFVRLGTPAGASVSADIAAVESHAVNIPSSFPANFSNLGITSSGKITEVALVDTLTAYTGNTPQSGDLYSVVNPMITAHVYTAPALANAPTSGGGSVNVTEIGGVAVTAPGSGSIAFSNSVSSYGGADTSGTTTLLARVGTPSTGSVSGDIASANSGITTANTAITNLASGNGLFIPGTVSTATSSSSFIVQFAGSAPPAAGLVGLYCCNTSSAHAPEKQPITSATPVDSTHVTLNFSTPFGVAPSSGDTVLVG